jgi:hypothetical protein
MAKMLDEVFTSFADAASRDSYRRYLRATPLNFAYYGLSARINFANASKTSSTSINVNGPNPTLGFCGVDPAAAPFPRAAFQSVNSTVGSATEYE